MMTFTDSAGLTGYYSVYGSHVTRTSEPTKLLLHLHGDGGYEAEHAPDKYYMTGPEGILTAAKAMNRVLIVPLSPVRDATVQPDGEGKLLERWWLNSGKQTMPWMRDFLKDKIIPETNADLDDFWVSGFSGGAEFISYFFAPQVAAQVGIAGGGGVMMGGGGGDPSWMNALLVGSPLKDKFTMSWYVGAGDTVGFNAVEASSNGESTYRDAGWRTHRQVIDGEAHLLDGIDGVGVYGRFILDAVSRG